MNKNSFSSSAFFLLQSGSSSAIPLSLCSSVLFLYYALFCQFVPNCSLLLVHWEGFAL